MAEQSITKIVIVGGGFAGVACAKLLAEEARAQVTLIDQNGYQQFQPLLYQVATAELAGKDIAFDHTEVFRGQSSITAVKAYAVAADVDRHSVTLADDTTISGDYRLAAGAQPNLPYQG
jgi:NADH dehydrogenase